MRSEIESLTLQNRAGKTCSMVPSIASHDVFELIFAIGRGEDAQRARQRLAIRFIEVIGSEKFVPGFLSRRRDPGLGDRSRRAVASSGDRSAAVALGSRNSSLVQHQA